jgi:hypothetical protein
MRVTHRAGGRAHGTKPRPRPGAVTRWAAWLSAGVVLAGLVAAGVWWLGQAVRAPSPPDLAAFSNSTAVRTEDQAAAHWLQQDAARLTSRARWVHLVGHARVDECSGSGRGGGLFGGGIGASVSCERTDTWYLAVAGGAPADQSKLERILHQADGWGRFAAAPEGTGSPPVLPTTTAQWVGPAEPPPPHDKIQLELIWVARRPELASAALGAAQAQVTADRVRYLVIIKPDLAGVSRKSFAAHRHVLVVSMSDSYFYSTTLEPPGAARPGGAPGRSVQLLPDLQRKSVPNVTNVGVGAGRAG